MKNSSILHLRTFTYRSYYLLISIFKYSSQNLFFYATLYFYFFKFFIETILKCRNFDFPLTLLHFNFFIFVCSILIAPYEISDDYENLYFLNQFKN